MAQGKIWQHEAAQTPTPECQAPNMTINAISYHTPTLAGVLSLHKNPPDEVMDELLCPAPNTTIDKTAYHTPTEVGAFALHKPPCTKNRCMQPPATQPKNPAPEHLQSPCRWLIYSTTHPLWRVPLPCAKTPPHEKWMCAATRHLTQEPPSTQTPTTYTSMVNIQYHTPTVVDTFAL
ncbi:hypothetical protein BS47DRAFT_1361513 [Hydnum rufescens UP504]|uniref:Uncharacterized protein n=1 Tax=Hydnum rufescens UP504 TaxID=1448309 RepID=A0A9P6AZC0_9AGAM|nr:hypothetical protein BS47DRAFT_1361513 [Hydnum rufescens UP504]